MVKLKTINDVISELEVGDKVKLYVGPDTGWVEGTIIEKQKGTNINAIIYTIDFSVAKIKLSQKDLIYANKQAKMYRNELLNELRHQIFES